ncbi:MAG: hypothetical protein AB3N28_09485 [Kordiimonas sp.]
MSTDNIRKRLIVTALALLGMIGLLAGWLMHQANSPYKVETISDTKLYIPTEYLGPKPEGLIEMVRNYIQGQSTQIRVQVPISELLNEVQGSRHENQSVIFTLEPNNEAPAPNLLPSADNNLLTAAARVENVLTERKSNGLLRIYGNGDDKSTFSFSNLEATSNNTVGNIWIAHCIHFRALRADSSWGRCSRQIIQTPIKISIHYDGELVRKTVPLTEAVLAKVQKWRMLPKHQ